LDGWLARIEADRAERAASGGSHSPRAGGGFGPREDGGGSPTRNPS
jgi:hypothetical protein